jgi:maltooligosyltrehalose trehalohydrolase
VVRAENRFRDNLSPGASPEGDGFTFTLWAPLRKEVSLKIIDPDGSVNRTTPMKRDAGGYFRAEISGLSSGTPYCFILDRKEERPDPASRFQPEGVHGPSMTVDIRGIPRQNHSWENPALEDYLIYELHVGTFTPGGTFEGIIERIPYLKDLGVTAVELMPVAQFPGERNWGYDGVYPYAVQRSYGGPEGLIKLIDALHEAGLAAVLDVVYNHLGPEGNYLRDFGPYFTDRYDTPWGEAVNFDGPESMGVRGFFINNALYWLFEFGFDALRLDAVHGIFDGSPVHILKEIKQAVNACPGGTQKYLIAESDLNETCIVNPQELGGYGLDAQWNDDFHHCLHTLLTAESDGYYMDFGSTEEIAKAYSEGYVYTGQFSKFRGKEHGTPSAHVPPGKLVVHSQTHDQVGNRMIGDRLCATLPLEKLRLAAAAVILSPYIPLIFMGEEYAEKAPFQYFISHSDPSLVEAVRKGRFEEFSSFAWKGTPPDPAEEATFLRSRLDMTLTGKEPHDGILKFYKKLIELRKKHPALGPVERERMEVIHIPGSRTIVVAIWDNKDGLMVLEILCFDETGPATLALPQGGRWPKTGSWKLLLDTSMPETPETSVRIGERVIASPMSLSLFEHVE